MNTVFDAEVTAQLVSAVLAGSLKVGFKQVLFHKYQDICTPNQPQHLTCPGSRIFFTSSIFWGIVGPDRQFGSGALYHPMLYTIVFGAFIPLPFWFWGRLHPNSVFAQASTPLWFSNSVPISPLSGISVSSSIMVGFIFQRVVRKRSFRWWAKFNYVAGAGLDAGTGFGAIVVFFALLVSKVTLLRIWSVYRLDSSYRRTGQYLWIGGVTEYGPRVSKQSFLRGPTHLTVTVQLLTIQEFLISLSLFRLNVNKELIRPAHVAPSHTLSIAS